MDKKKIIKRISRRGPVNQEERKRLQEIREKVSVEFPPREPPRLQLALVPLLARPAVLSAY